MDNEINKYQLKAEIRKKYKKTNHDTAFLQALENAGNREILIWGACERGKKIFEKIKLQLHFLGKFGGYIDSNDEINEYDGFKCIRPENVDKSKNFIVFALLNNYDSVDSLLSEKDFLHYKDYIRFYNSAYTITSVDGYYFDEFGNEIYGDFKNAEVVLQGYDNLLVIESDTKISDVLFVLNENSIIFIAEKVFLGSGGIRFSVRTNSFLYIDENTTIIKNDDFLLNQKSFCYVGKDCMFSYNIDVTACDGHNLFDLNTKRNLNKNKVYEIIIRDHVWLGKNSTILYGADIGSGSVLGSNSFVNKKVPPNVVVAGNPSKIIRENVAWDRSQYPFSEDYSCFKAFDFRENK